MIQGAEMLALITAGMPVRSDDRPASARTVRLTLRLSFREWSEGVSRDGLKEVRRWINTVEERVNRC